MLSFRPSSLYWSELLFNMLDIFLIIMKKIAALNEKKYLQFTILK